MAQLIAAYHRTAHGQSHARTGENAPRPGKPSGQITGKPGIPSRRQFIRPKVLSTRVGIGARELTQTDAHSGTDEGDQHDAIDDEHGSARVDAGDEGGGDSEPGVCEREADAQDGEDGVIALHVLGVAHFGEFEGVGVEGFNVGDGGGVGGPGVDGEVLLLHFGGRRRPWSSRGGGIEV